MWTETPNIDIDNLLLVWVMKWTEMAHGACNRIQCSRQVQTFINTLLTFAGESQNDILWRAADHVIEKMMPEEEIV